MGTTVSNLQILGASLEDVRAALPRTLVGQWSERFVTACPDLSPRNTERRAASLSKKLDCTLLLVAMFDGDALWLTVYRGGKRLTGHAALPENCKAGNPKLFCSALGLPEELAPKLKRLFTDCSMQEEKLGILQALLGAPLFLRWDDGSHLPTAPIQADSGPLEEWVREHPAPPKIKNQGKAELIQEIPDRGLDYRAHALIFRPAVHKGDTRGGYAEHISGDFLGYFLRGGEWARPLPDGRMELTPLADPSIGSTFDNFGYAHLDSRLVTTAVLYGPDPSGYPGAQRPVQTVVVHDTAGVLPCPLALEIDGSPAVSGHLWLLPDGGFLAAVAPRYDGSRPPVQIREPALVCYGPDSVERWIHWGIDYVVQVAEDRIYAVTPERGDTPKHLLVLDMDGSVSAECPVPFSPYSTQVRFIGGVPCFLEPLDYQKDALLHRLTPNLRPDGEVLVPYMSSLALSPDNALLYAAGYESGLRVIDAASLNIIRDLPKRANLHTAIADCQNRLWVGNGGYFECYTPELEMISRHRLTGDLCQVYRNDAGQVCALTFQQKKYMIRVYRFS